jgi:GR25 family glycosyltransferase involved in LPS biosynthesis
MKLLEHIYVITIERNIDRQVRMTNLLKPFGLAFSFIFGIDGRKISDKDLNNVIDAEKSKKRLKYDLSKNEIACSLSHINALKTFLENDKLDYALFLEDDISISNLESLEAAVKLMPKPSEWDLLYLGYQQMNMKMPLKIYLKWLLVYPILNSLRLKQYDLQKIKRIFGRAYNNYWFRAGSHNNAHAYIVSKSAAKKIINYNTPVFLQADVVLMDMIVEGKLRAFALNKPVFYQSDYLPSSIGARESWV